ncbi:hypothetical protein VTJ83DRAFT_5840 [Remersonia thermophila]|uniref:Gfo/Idh/MocA-like oxidoreductase N-terminal domain-containing protein n=1 Tax=Remersonia thermophila TaxID=72144 RepID=A0ABR4D849_9PEZI
MSRCWVARVPRESPAGSQGTHSTYWLPQIRCPELISFFRRYSPTSLGHERSGLDTQRSGIMKLLNVLMVGTGEHTAGFVGGGASGRRQEAAIDALSPGNAITIFTLDITHYPIALYAIERGIYVLMTKPAGKLLEHHKRYGPAYRDARARDRQHGDFNCLSSCMSQPKVQLETLKVWTGVDSDIRTTSTATAPNIWGTMVWPGTTPPPFYMRYAPDEDGHFNGRSGYGCVSLDKFVDTCRAINAGELNPADLGAKGLPTLRNTVATAAILEAGRRSLDAGRPLGGDGVQILGVRPLADV